MILQDWTGIGDERHHHYPFWMCLLGQGKPHAAPPNHSSSGHQRHPDIPSITSHDISKNHQYGNSPEPTNETNNSWHGKDRAIMGSENNRDTEEGGEDVDEGDEGSGDIDNDKGDTNDTKKGSDEGSGEDRKGSDEDREGLCTTSKDTGEENDGPDHHKINGTNDNKKTYDWKLSGKTDNDTIADNRKTLDRKPSSRTDNDATAENRKTLNRKPSSNINDNTTANNNGKGPRKLNGNLNTAKASKKNDNNNDSDQDANHDKGNTNQDKRNTNQDKGDTNHNTKSQEMADDVSNLNDNSDILTNDDLDAKNCLNGAIDTRKDPLNANDSGNTTKNNCLGSVRKVDEGKFFLFFYVHI